MTIYDEAKAHWDRLPGDLPRKAAGTHIGMFVAWALERSLGSPLHEKQHGEALARLTRRWSTGRDYLLEELDGVLAEEHLNTEGNAFAQAYYLSGKYLRDYEEHLRGHSPTLYHVRDDYGNYDRLTPVVDARLAAWRRSQAAVPAPPPVVPETAAPAAEPAPLPVSGTPSPPPRATSARRAEPAPAPTPRSPPRERRRAATPRPAPHRTLHTWRRRGGGKGGLAILLFVLAAVGGWFWIESQEDRRRSRSRTDRLVEEKTRQIREAIERARRRHPSRRTFQRDVPPRERTRQPPWPKLSEAQVAAAAELGVAVQFENGLGMRFVLIPHGTFVMGSPPSEPGRHAGEVAHNVIIKTPFYMQVAEVSNALFRRFRRSHRCARPPGMPSFDGAGQPATSVGYHDALAFSQWVQQRDPGHLYRLPREAEWEYACRAGAAGRFWWGESERDAGHFANVADWSARSQWPMQVRIQAEADEAWRWFDTRDGQAVPAPVASLRASPWGLYDMLGNVHEWCADWAGPYDSAVALDPVGPLRGTHRILRGGAFDTPVWMTRCAYRGGLEPGASRMNVGFRLVAELP